MTPAERVRVKRVFRLYDLRHTFATLLLAKGLRRYVGVVGRESMLESTAIIKVARS